MKPRTILFPFDENDVVKEKVTTLTKIVGKDNIVTEGINFQIPEITIRCDKKNMEGG